MRCDSILIGCQSNTKQCFCIPRWRYQGGDCVPIPLLGCETVWDWLSANQYTLSTLWDLFRVDLDQTIIAVFSSSLWKIKIDTRCSNYVSWFYIIEDIIRPDNYLKCTYYNTLSHKSYWHWCIYLCKVECKLCLKLALEPNPWVGLFNWALEFLCNICQQLVNLKIIAQLGRNYPEIWHAHGQVYAASKPSPQFCGPCWASPLPWTRVGTNLFLQERERRLNESPFIQVCYCSLLGVGLCQIQMCLDKIKNLLILIGGLYILYYEKHWGP